MIQGIGADVVQIERIRKAMRNPRFTKRILTETERAHADSAVFVAGRWAAKEAIAKAVGCSLSWQDVEVLPNAHGAPVVHWRNGWSRRIHVSISHERSLAFAVAVWESEE
ncbi:MAG: holo-[acyl-carrier-protein] synthase [Armatimonadota bacterium]